MSDMPREIAVYRDRDLCDVPELRVRSTRHNGSETPYILKSEHAKLEAANKVLREALDNIHAAYRAEFSARGLDPDDSKLMRETDAAVKAADEIMKG